MTSRRIRSLRPSPHHQIRRVNIHPAAASGRRGHLLLPACHRDDPPILDVDGDINLGKDLRTVAHEQHRRTMIHPPNVVDDSTDRPPVEMVGWFIEYEQRGSVDERPRYRYPLALPPERKIPSSPIAVSTPSGKSWMSASASASLNAVSMSVREMSSRPYRMFSRIVPERRSGGVGRPPSACEVR